MSTNKTDIESELAEINEKLQDPLVFSSKDYPYLAKRQNELNQILTLFKNQSKLLNDIEEAKNIIKSNADDDLKDLAESEIESLSQELDETNSKLNSLIVPQDPNNSRSVIIEIRAAAGGDESSLFASELFRMYSRWSENHNYKIEILSENANEVGGFKEIIFSVNGVCAYKNLKYEAGVHRVQRVPTTESQGRIHTSTVTVAVLPEAEEKDIEINPNDLRIDVYRSSGHGGQSVNTTDSAVRITHIPTGIMVANQDEKSQIKNKAKALSILRARLLAIKIEDEQKKLSEARIALIGSGDRSEKIRTYNFPQDRITDHRINYSRSNIPQAMDGDIDDIISKLQEAEAKIVNEEKR